MSESKLKTRNQVVSSPRDGISHNHAYLLSKLYKLTCKHCDLHVKNFSTRTPVALAIIVPKLEFDFEVIMHIATLFLKSEKLL